MIVDDWEWTQSIRMFIIPVSIYQRLSSREEYDHSDKECSSAQSFHQLRVLAVQS